jgi:uncharacterized protein
VPQHYRWDGAALLLFCHLQPGASRDEFAGLHGERLKIRIAAPPLDGRANGQLIAFLAAQCGVAKQAVSIVSGAGGRHKTVRIEHPATLPPGLCIASP